MDLPLIFTGNIYLMSYVCTLRMRLNTFCAFGDNFVYPDLTYSLYALNYFPRILRGCLSTFRALSVGA